MSHHPSNIGSLVRITASIPWSRNELNNRIQARDWISKPDPSLCTSPNWIYYVLEPHRGIAKAIEFKKITLSGLIHGDYTLNERLPTCQNSISRQARLNSEGGQRRTDPWQEPTNLLDLRNRIYSGAPLGPKGVALASHSPLRGFTFLQLHNKKRLQERSKINAYTQHAHLHTRT